MNRVDTMAKMVKMVKMDKMNTMDGMNKVDKIDKIDKIDKMDTMIIQGRKNMSLLNLCICNSSLLRHNIPPLSFALLSH